MKREYEANYRGVYNGRALVSCPRCGRYAYATGTRIKCTVCSNWLIINTPAAKEFIPDEEA